MHVPLEVPTFDDRRKELRTRPYLLMTHLLKATIVAFVFAATSTVASAAPILWPTCTYNLNDSSVVVEFATTAERSVDVIENGCFGFEADARYTGRPPFRAGANPDPSIYWACTVHFDSYTAVNVYSAQDADGRVLAGTACDLFGHTPGATTS